MEQLVAERRDKAIRLGLEFIYRTACDEEHFETWGHDYLSCFQGIASTSKDADLSTRARHWRRKNAAVPADADATTIVKLMYGAVAANQLDVRDTALTPQIRQAAAGFTARDYFLFNPVTEAPPSDVPEDCECGADNPRGCNSCSRCGRPLEMIGRYGVYIDLCWQRRMPMEAGGTSMRTTFMNVTIRRGLPLMDCENMPGAVKGCMFPGSCGC